MVDTVLSPLWSVSTSTLSDDLLQPGASASRAIGADDETLDLIARATHDEGSFERADTSWDESLLAVLMDHLG